MEWEQLGRIIRPGELVEIDVSPTPIGAVMRGSRVVVVVATRQSSSEVVIEVYRYDPRDAPTNPINLDRYRVWEGLPSNQSYLDMVNSASTEDNANMRGFIEDHVFLAKDETTEGHWLPELPDRVRALLRRR
jgi:hypothetical protein